MLMRTASTGKSRPGDGFPRRGVKRKKNARSINCILGYLLVSLLGFAIVMFISVQYNPHWLNGFPIDLGARAVNSFLNIRKEPASFTQTSLTTEEAKVGTGLLTTTNSPSQAVPNVAKEMQTEQINTKDFDLKPVSQGSSQRASIARGKVNNEPAKVKPRKGKGWREEKREQKEKQREEDQREFEFRKQEEKYIRVMPTRGKPEIKQNRRVVLDLTSYSAPKRPPGPASGVRGQPRAYMQAREALAGHPLHIILPPSDPVQSSQLHLRRSRNATTDTLEGALQYLQGTTQCRGLPIFLSMANAGDELYWQLIENFVYTMVKFGVSDCAFVICVSDPHCMNLCKESLFPCFDYRYTLTLPVPSVMEQIAAVKLYHIPKAMAKGVDVFMLDLDVGFLQTPRLLIKPFEETPTIDVFVQEDYLFIMNRTKAGWKSWFTEPLPNIGLFLARGNDKVRDVFSIAWKKYQTMDDAEVKSNPGKDQNHVLEGMRIGRGTFGLRYAYFDNSTAALMDKIVQKYRNIELGGEAASRMLEDEHTVAMHTTCYEQSTKVMGLKATNAFWNPKYYDPLRPTLTKLILFISEEQLLDEMRSLVFLAIATRRAFIAPNLLGDESGNHGVTERYRGRAMWPGFRVIKFKRSKGINELRVDVLEPAFYWRTQRDYDDVPEASIVYFDPKEKLSAILQRLKSVKSPRVILHASLSGSADPATDTRLKSWAGDSVGIFEPFAVEQARYYQIPSLKDNRENRGVEPVLQGMRNCEDIFGKLKGNRTCFQICQ